VPDVYGKKVCKSYGASGFVNMIAPLPGSDGYELPIQLDAIILAKILDPQGSK
jgi:hypothetical protein